MRRKLFSIAACIFMLLFIAPESVVLLYAQESADSNVDVNALAEKIRMKALQKKLNQQNNSQQKLVQLWNEVDQAIDSDDDGAVVAKLQEILRLDPTSQKAKEMLEIYSPQLPAPQPIVQGPVVKAGTKAGERMVLKINNVEFAFRWCPAGTFMMGAPANEVNQVIGAMPQIYQNYPIANPLQLEFNETQHQVTLTKGFWILETEVTQKQWKVIMGSNPSTFHGDDNPVENLSYSDCYHFCQKFANFGYFVKLPTEAQWEYACRAGSTGPFAGNLDEIAWYKTQEVYSKENQWLQQKLMQSIYNSNVDMTTPVEIQGTHKAVGKKKPNAWGIYDMHGNVCEICEDLYASYPKWSVTDPKGEPTNGIDHVVRGGNWKSPPHDCRSAARAWDGAEYFMNTFAATSNDYLGFRIVIEPTVVNSFAVPEE